LHFQDLYYVTQKAGLSNSIVQSFGRYMMRAGGAHDLLNTGANFPQNIVKGGWVKTDNAM
jgi:hypothetical protein